MTVDAYLSTIWLTRNSRYIAQFNVITAREFIIPYDHCHRRFSLYGKRRWARSWNASAAGDSSTASRRPGATSWDEFASQNKELKTGGPRSEWGFRRAIHETINSLHVGQFFGDLKYLSNAQKFHVELRVRNLRINASSTQRKSFVRNPSRTEKTTQKINKRHFLKMINVFSVHETHATPRRCSGSSNSDCIRQFFHLL